MSVGCVGGEKIGCEDGDGMSMGVCGWWGWGMLVIILFVFSLVPCMFTNTLRAQSDERSNLSLPKDKCWLL